MSGLPNPAGVRKLRSHLIALSKTVEQIRTLSKMIKDSQTKMRDLIEAEKKINDEIRGCLTEMDVASPGNTGWEMRHRELLLMLVERTERAENEHS